ncbi:hypothetical protein [Runella zeae]|uniref:hypothetical protein n=1 Tax=Runella zeae TaxID=94255 RepID=UPI00048E890E|nr:hypothetical protein [Runella zeae]
MNEIERDELYEKYLMGEADEMERQQVEKMITSNKAYRAEFETQKILLAHIRQNRRRELKDMFVEFEEEMKTGGLATKAEEEPEIGKVIKVKWWQSSVVRYAAAITGILLIAGILVWNNWPKTGDEIAGKDDSTKTVKDSTLKQQLEGPKPLEQIAQDIPQKQYMEGVISLPIYESSDSGMGFGKNQKAKDTLVVRFEKSGSPAYEFGDTLTISMPYFFAYSSKWRIVYDRLNDTYYFTDGKIRYVLIKGAKEPMVEQK